MGRIPYQPIHQGDISMHPLKSVKKGFKLVKNPAGNILRLGESSGHAHVLEGNYRMFAPTPRIGSPSTQRIVEIMDKPAILRHIDLRTGKQADHRPITIPQGIYLVRFERAWDPIADREIGEILD